MIIEIFINIQQKIPIYKIYRTVRFINYVKSEKIKYLSFG